MGGGNPHLRLTSNLIIAQRHNTDSFITPNSLLLCHPSLQMFHFYLHSNKHGSNALRYGSGRVQAATMLAITGAVVMAGVGAVSSLIGGGRLS